MAKDLIELTRGMDTVEVAGGAGRVEKAPVGRSVDIMVVGEKGVCRLCSNPCMYIWHIGEDFTIIMVWVDNLLLFAMMVRLMNKMKADIKGKWEVTDLGEPSKIIGIEITKGKDSITILQMKYIESILRKKGLERANPVTMPLDPNTPLKPNPEGNIGDCSNSFARLLGELQFIANTTRPDIAYAVNRLALYTANLSL